MIIETLVDVIFALVEGILGLVPTIEVPEFMQEGGELITYAGTVGGYLAAADQWLPVALLGPVVTAIFAALGFSVLVRFVRFLISVFTGGGGA